MFYQRATIPFNAARSRTILTSPSMLAIALLMTGCAASNPATKSGPETVVNGSSVTANRVSQSTANLAASIAGKQVGVPYRYGGADPKGFDCSGLVYYSYSGAGRPVARTTAGLWDTLQPIPVDGLQTGDVLFFDIDGKMSHVGMYLGGGLFVHAPSTGRRVSVAQLDSDFYSRALIRGGRAD